MISDKFSIREKNESLVLEQIILNKSVSRAELAQITHLNKASISSITKKFLEEHLVIETGIGSSSEVGGRKPILVKFDHQAALAISIDLGTDYCEGVVSFLNGEIIKHQKHRTLHITQSTVITVILDLIHEITNDLPKTPHGIIGVSVAIHGSVLNQEIIYTPNYQLYGFDLVEALTRELEYPVYIENEANLAALGEYTFSSEKNDLISLSIHSGIGAGIVENGHLKIGHQGKAGEFGHTILFPDGKDCPCGNKGCIERYVSQSAIYETVKDRLNIDDVNSDIITELIQQKNYEVEKIMKDSIKYLAIGLNNLITTFDPEIIIINSSICSKNPELIELILADLNSMFTKNISIQNSPLQNRATLYGGIAHTTKNFLNVTNLKFI